MKDFLTISSDAIPSSARVLGFRGKEALSRLYSFEIFITIDPEEWPEFDPGAAVTQRATLEITRDDGVDPFAFHGILAGVEALREVPDGHGIYRLTLVPKLWLLTQTFHSRLYTDKKVPEIIEAILKDAGLGGADYELKLDASYAANEHVCQYRESDFDFISRWMEREGIYYFFEHGEKQEKVIITDTKGTHEDIRKKPVPYHPITASDITSAEAFHAFTCRHITLPASVKLKDYDYLKPTLDVSGSADVDGAGAGVLATYGVRFFTPDDGKRLADIRAKQLVATQVIYSGSGSITHLRSGYLFDLEEHPRAAFNATYLVTELSHFSNQRVTTHDLVELTGLHGKEGYVVELKAISAEVQFRPERVTAWPRIYGVENALVDGPADSDYAQIDKHGRYEVKFYFDESDLEGGKASTWIRMLQPHAGNPEGFHFPLRKGTEVLVVFLGGDPDRPVIAGAVPNMPNPSPVTASNNTQNVIHTGGNTRIEIEDKDGGQYIDISTPPKDTFIHLGEAHGEHTHNIVEHTEGNCLFEIGGDQDIEVGGDLSEEVTGDVGEEYGGDQDTEVAGDKTLEVAGDYDIEVGGDMTIEVGGDRDIEVGGDQTVEIGGDHDIEVAGDETLEIENDYDIEVGGDMTVEVGGDAETEIAGKWEISVDGEIKIECESYEVEQRGQVIWKTLGDFLHTKITASHETTVGFKSELLIGGKSDIVIGAAADVLVGGKAEVFVGASFKFEAAAALEITMGPKLELESMHFHNKATEAKHAAARLASIEANLANHEAMIWMCAIAIMS